MHHVESSVYLGNTPKESPDLLILRLHDRELVDPARCLLILTNAMQSADKVWPYPIVAQVHFDGRAIYTVSAKEHVLDVQISKWLTRMLKELAMVRGLEMEELVLSLVCALGH